MKKESALYKKIYDLFILNLEGENRYLSDAVILESIFPNVTSHLGDAYILILHKIRRSIPVVREMIEVDGYLMISDMKDEREVRGRKIAKDKEDEENFHMELQRRKGRCEARVRSLERGLNAARESKLISEKDGIKYLQN